MERTKALLVISLLLFSLCSCGRKGPILPPIRRLPEKVKGLSARQIGEIIRLSWTNPDSNTDETPLSIGCEVEIWLYSAEKESVDAQSTPSAVDFGDHSDWLIDLARTAAESEKETESAGELPEEYDFLLEDDDALNKVYVFALRIKDGKRYSGFASPVKIEPEAVSLPPANLRAEVTREQIQLKWDAPAANIDGSSPPAFEGYNIYRQDGGEEEWRLNSTLLLQNSYEDKSFSFGSSYSYFVRTVFPSEESMNESGDSIPIPVDAEDIYPPGAPQGLIAIPGSNQISVSWDSNTEGDLAGYRIWRRENGEPEFKLMNFLLLQRNSFEDKKVVKGLFYEYTVTAVDSEGNESEKSGVASAELKGSRS